MKDFLSKSFLNNSIQDWLIALGIALAAVVVARTIYWAIEKYVKKITEKTKPR